jgi:hypothetical protein
MTKVKQIKQIKQIKTKKEKTKPTNQTNQTNQTKDNFSYLHALYLKKKILTDEQRLYVTLHRPEYHEEIINAFVKKRGRPSNKTKRWRNMFEGFSSAYIPYPNPNPEIIPEQS